MIAALKEIVAACKANGIRAGLHCGTPDYAARAIEWGFDMTMVSGELEASRRSGRGQRGEVPATDGSAQFDIRKGSLFELPYGDRGSSAGNGDTRPFQTHNHYAPLTQ